MDPNTTYSFTVYNRSGGVQNYSLLSQPPSIEPTPEGLVSHPLLNARDVPSSTGTATFVIQRDSFFAVCGTVYQHEAACMSVLDRQPVRLGTGPPHDARGTAVVLKTAASGQSPCFGFWEGSGADWGGLGAFCLKTGDGFTLKEARDGHLMVALGLSVAPNDHVGLHAAFTPAPSTKYQIRPSRIYYILPVSSTEVKQEYKAGEIDLSRALKIDFSSAPPHVTIVHDGDNTLALLDENHGPLVSKL